MFVASPEVGQEEALDIGREEEVGSIETAQATTPEVKEDEDVIFEIAE